MHRYLISIKLHGGRNRWRGLVAKSWWPGCKMKCAKQRQQIYSVLPSFWPLLRRSVRAALSRGVPVANRKGLRGESTLTPVLPGSTF